MEEDVIMKNLEIFESRSLKSIGKIISINSNHGFFSKELAEELQITTDSFVILAKEDKELYFAVLPIDSTKKGYTVSKPKKTRTLNFSIPKILHTEIKSGIYELDKPKFYQDIDWFKLIKKL